MPTLRRIDPQSAMPTSSQQPQQANQQHTMTTMATMVAEASDGSSTNTSLDKTIVSLALTHRRNNNVATASLAVASTALVPSTATSNAATMETDTATMETVTASTTQNSKRTITRGDKENILNVPWVRCFIA